MPRDLNGIVTYATAQGARAEQQDRFVHLPFLLRDGSKGHLLAVMDGHRGETAAERCKELIPQLFSLKQASDAEAALQELVAKLHEATKELIPGTTISLACICERKRTATVAVLGDSPVFVLDRSETFYGSVEHNVRTNEKELKAALARGALFEGGYLVDPISGTGLQMSRTLGNEDLDKYLSREPEITSFKLGPGSIVVVCSDGMTDPEHSAARENELPFSFMLLYHAEINGGDAQKVLAWRKRFKGGLHDNATVLVWVDGTACE